MAIQRQSYVKRKDADYSRTLEWAIVWLQNTDDPDSAILSDRVTAELIHITLMQSSTLETKQNMPEAPLGPCRLSEHTTTRISTLGTLSAS